MTSNATLISAPPEKNLDFRIIGIEPKYRPVTDETVVTLAEAVVGAHKPEIRLLDRAYSVWGSLHDDDTVISIGRPLASFFEPLDVVCLRRPRLPNRYSAAAEELRQLLPGVGLDTLAKMCGVSDTGYRNWLRGKGIREKQLRRLLAIRSLVRALVIQRGQTAASEWMQKPHPQLSGQSPTEAICDGHLDDVLALALNWKTPQRRSIIPQVESGDDLDAHEAAAEQQLAPVEVYSVF